MPEYGLTPQGPNIKRLDVILDDMHAGLSEAWGVNTRQNPESLVNHLLTNVADAIAQLWEFGEKIYYSQYPASAEGVSLDNAAQYGGSTREQAAKSYYPIHCEGNDGTRLVAGTTIASATNPITMLSLTEDRTISRTACNSAKIRVAAMSAGSVYTIVINGTLYSVTAASDSTEALLNALADAINAGDGFSASVDSENLLLRVWDNADASASNSINLSENLTTETVTSVINFGTEEYGDIYLPDGVITNIVRADAGLIAVVNQSGYIPGREQETDTEFRQSYVDKIFNRSSMMLESIRSAILNNVQGVKSVATYENSTNVTMCESTVLTLSVLRANTDYIVVIDGEEFCFTSLTDDPDDILAGLEAEINDGGYTSTDLDTGAHRLGIEFTRDRATHTVTTGYGVDHVDTGRPPHSIEIIVDGGDNLEIAKQIFDKKAAGIQTFGDVEVTIPGNYDEDILIRFNRPETIYVWFDVALTQLPGATLPANYVDLLKEVILKKMENLDAGDEVIPQAFMTELHAACPGIAYIDINLFHTAEEGYTPSEYTERIVTITARQRAKTTETMIGVRFSG